MKNRTDYFYYFEPTPNGDFLTGTWVLNDCYMSTWEFKLTLLSKLKDPSRALYRIEKRSRIESRCYV